MKSKIFIFFLTSLLLLAFFGAGTAAADTQLEGFLNNDNEQILNYNVTIYINGDMVTIVNNYESSDYPVRQFNEISNSANNDIFSKFAFNEQKNIIQFNISELGLMENDESYEEFTVCLCGNIIGDFENNHCDHEIRFRAEKIFEEPPVEDPADGTPNVGVMTAANPADESPEYGDEAPITPTYKIIVYPIQNSFTHDFYIPAYYSVDFGSVFLNEAIYPDFKEELIGKNVIYSFERGALRSVYWYDAETEELVYKSADSVNAYEHEFLLDLSDLKDFNLNSLFICSKYNKYTISDYENPDKTVIIDDIPCSCCSSDVCWGVTIGGSEKEASCYLMTYDDLYPIEEDGNVDSDCPSIKFVEPVEEEPVEEELAEEKPVEEEIENPRYSHFISFNSSALSGDLLKNRNLSVQFYPIIVFENDEKTELADESNDSRNYDSIDKKPEKILDISYQDNAHSFLFKRMSQSISTTVGSDGFLHLVGNQLEVKKPLLSSMIFPSSIQNKLEGNSLVLSSLSSAAFKDIEDSSGLITPETKILSVMDIGFENNGSEINGLLKKNNQNVTLTFSVPRVINETNVDPKKLEVLHIVDVDGAQTTELLTINSVEPGEINGVKCYNITTGTSGFSTFAVISSEVKVSENISNAGDRSFGEAAVVPPEEEADAETTTAGYSNDIPPLTAIEGIITKIQGYLSVFSVLVILTSGLFMWDYIRRRI